MINLNDIPLDEAVLRKELDDMIRDHIHEIDNFIEHENLIKAHDQFERLFHDITFIVTGMYFLSDPITCLSPEIIENINQSFENLVLLGDQSPNQIDITGTRIYLKFSKIALGYLFNKDLSLEQLQNTLEKIKTEIASENSNLSPSLRQELNLYHQAISVTLLDHTKETAGPMAASPVDTVWDYKKFIENNNEILNKVIISSRSRSACSFFLTLERIDEAEEVSQFGLELAREINYPTTILGNLLMLGNVYRHKGELDAALDCYLRCMQVQGIPSKLLYHYPIRYIGYILQTRGELETALEYYKVSLRLFQIASSDMPIGRNYIMIGGIAYMKGEYRKAIENYLKALEIFSELNHFKNVVEVLFHLIQVNIDTNQITKANDYLLTIKGIKERINHPVIDHQYFLANALILMQSKRRKHKAEAQEYLEKIYTQKILNFEFVAIAMKHLCFLLIDEMGDELDEEIFLEAEELATQLQKIGEEQQIYTISIDAILLQAQFDLIRGNMKESIERLTKAGNMCKDKGLVQLSKEVTNYTENFLGQFRRWEKIINNNPSISERMTHAEVRKYIQFALKQISE